MARILEEDLHLPALYLIEQESGVIVTSVLSDKLRDILNPKGEDLEILNGRNDDKFSQIVRNLTATERSFVKNNYITRESGRNKPLFITEKGREYLNKNTEIIDYLLTNNFNFHDLIDSFKEIQKANKKHLHSEIFNENITVYEGSQVAVKTKVYKRSNKLRKKAIQFYTIDNRIKCKACCFDFEDFYGKYGKGFIEIHHQKPIFQFDGDDTEQTIAKALSNVIPICPNCHRMIHRSKINPLTLKEIKEHIKTDLDFCED